MTICSALQILGKDNEIGVLHESGRSLIHSLPTTETTISCTNAASKHVELLPCATRSLTLSIPQHWGAYVCKFFSLFDKFFSLFCQSF